MVDTSKRYRRWEQEEDDKLSAWWSELKLGLIAKRLKRTIVAVQNRARVLKLPPTNRGNVSLKEYAEKIGYSRNAVLGAVRVLKLKVGRVPSGSVIRTLKGSKQRMWTGRFYRFETDHQKAILDYLTKKDRLHQWGIDGRPDRCVKCHRTTFFHCRLGYCRRCVANLRDRAKKGKGGEEAQLIHKTRQVRKAYVRKKPYKYRIVQCLECRRKVRVYVVVLPRFKGKCRLCRHNHNQRVNRRKQTIQKRLTHEDREDA